MDTAGLTRRIGRLFDEASGRTVMLPIDQPVSFGPLPGLIDLDTRLPLLLETGPEVLIAHRGALRRVRPEASRRQALIMHLSAGTSLSGRGHVKTLTGGVEDALRVGADGVSVQVSFGVPEETAMLSALASVASDCDRWGMPLLAMVYVEGTDPAAEPEKIAHAARAAAELGANIVKVPYTGSPESFAGVVDGCFTPVVIAGGERAGSWDDVLSAISGAMAAGATGVCVGRNVFQHDDPPRAMRDVRAIVHKPGLREWRVGG
jgi:predicted phospho-2-dehydro-3-deoxyheptonate aldolase